MHTYTHKLIYGDVRSAGLALCLVLLHIHFSVLMAKQIHKNASPQQAKTCQIIHCRNKKPCSVESFKSKTRTRDEKMTKSVTEYLCFLC